MVLKLIKIRKDEMGLVFRDGDFRGLLEPGRRWFIDPLYRVKVQVISQRAPWLVHDKLDLIIKSGVLADRAVVLDLQDYERALVWIDGRLTGRRSARSRSRLWTPAACASRMPTCR